MLKMLKDFVRCAKRIVVRLIDDVELISDLIREVGEARVDMAARLGVSPNRLSQKC